MAISQPNTDMRLHYLASEKGCRCKTVISGGNETYSLITAYDNTTTPVGPGASLATAASYVASVDPTITGAT